MLKAFVSASNRERGATAVEYGIMVALIAAVIIGTVSLIGDQLVAAFNDVLEELRDAPVGGAGD